MVQELPLQESSSILDPACGSGSFLRAAIAKLRSENPKIAAEQLAQNICGIDIHPLSVQIAKTTTLLALSEVLAKAKKPITLHIYLANSLLVPQQTADLFKSTFKVSIDNRRYAVDIGGVIGQDKFDQLITLCNDIVERFPKLVSRDRFVELVESNVKATQTERLSGQLYDVYCGLKRAKDAGRDSIWKFILQNTYKPVFLKNRFDFVIGNPPWLTYSGITNADYQAEIKRLADDYQVTPASKANMPHLEIASVFLAHSVNYFLKPSGVLGFVLPRSFMSADQHDRTRGGETKGVKLISVWDLQDVSPLFRVPSCVFFATGFEGDGPPIPKAGIPGLTFAARLPRFQMHWTDASSRIKTQNVRWYYSRLSAGNRRSRSALTAAPGDSLIGANAYSDRFAQGATIVPRSFYFVELDENVEEHQLKDRVVILRSSRSMLREAKLPWKTHTISGRMEGAVFISNRCIQKYHTVFPNKPLVCSSSTLDRG